MDPHADPDDALGIIATLIARGDATSPENLVTALGDYASDHHPSHGHEPSRLRRVKGLACSRRCHMALYWPPNGELPQAAGWCQAARRNRCAAWKMQVQVLPPPLKTSLQLHGFLHVQPRPARGSPPAHPPNLTLVSRGRPDRCSGWRTRSTRWFWWILISSRAGSPQRVSWTRRCNGGGTRSGSGRPDPTAIPHDRRARRGHARPANSWLDATSGVGDDALSDRLRHRRDP